MLELSPSVVFLDPRSRVAHARVRDPNPEHHMNLIVTAVFAASFALAVGLQRASRRFPSNQLISRVRRDGPRRTWLLVVFAAVYLTAAGLLLAVGNTGQPSWLAVPAFLFCWNGVKLLAASVVLPLRHLLVAGRA